MVKSEKGGVDHELALDELLEVRTHSSNSNGSDDDDGVVTLQQCVEIYHTSDISDRSDRSRSALGCCAGSVW